MEKLSYSKLNLINNKGLLMNNAIKSILTFSTIGLLLFAANYDQTVLNINYTERQGIAEHYSID